MNRLFSRYAVSAACLAASACAAFFLQCDIDYLKPASAPFSVRVSAGPSVYIHDTFAMRVSIPEPDVWGVRYVWFVDSAAVPDTTGDTVLKKIFGVGDTGLRRVMIKAVDGCGRESPEETCKVDVLYHRPVAALYASGASPIHTGYSLRMTGYTLGSRIAYYAWYIDDPQETQTTVDSTVTWVWGVADTGRHVVVARAVDLDGIGSRPCSLRVNVTCAPPSLALAGDTSALINAPYSLMLCAYDSDRNIAGFTWFIDDPLACRTTLDTLVSWTWSVRDTGERILVARAFDRDSLWSPPCSLRVSVGFRRPVVRLYGDTVSFTGASYTLRVSGRGGSSGIDRFVWYLDGPLASNTSFDTLFTWTWGAEDTGGHAITAYAVDRDGIVSDRAELPVLVLPGAPLIAQFHDTTISSLDTLTITCLASDPNGTVQTFLWDFNGGDWDDSTAGSSYLLRYGGEATVPVTVGVRDNDGVVSTAAFTVVFNRPPDSIIVSRPASEDTVVYAEKDVTGTVDFSCSSFDPDNDPILFSLWWRAEADTVDSLVWQGAAQSFQVSGVNPGRYLWRLEARDTWGHARTAAGSVAVIREHRICFMGHSIVAGTGGTDSTGGFRAGVLDSMRRVFGPYERIKPAGPTASSYMVNSPADDSCMAVIGIRAKDLFNTVSAMPYLNVDVWVLMIGVNDLYNPQELSYTILLLDWMASRNPAGRLYVLNGNQIAGGGASYWLPSFNQGLHDAVVSRAASGTPLFEVDAYTALSDSSGNYDPALFADGLHPNPAGYGRLVDVIFSTMTASVPPVISTQP